MLSGKTALVTGASRGIGKSIAIELAKHNASVIVNYSHSAAEAEAAVNEIKKLGKDAIAIKADVSNPDDVKKMLDEIKSKFGKLDILVNNAGVTKDRSLWKMSPEEWNKVISVNLDSIFLVTKNALPLMQKDSRIISISSIVGLYGNFGQCNYAASKAGIIGFTKSLAKEVAKQQITVNAIAPGFIESEMTDKIPFLKKKITLWMIPMKRAGLPEEIANVAAFLASAKSGYITGQTISVNGGFAF